jgi:hypothetical protein
MSQKTTYEIVIENVGLHENVKKDLSVENAEKQWIPRAEVNKLLSEVWSVLSDMTSAIKITQAAHQRALNRLFKITKLAQGIDKTKIRTEEDKEETYKRSKEEYKQIIDDVYSMRDKLYMYAPESADRDEVEAYIANMLRMYQDKMTAAAHKESESE